MMKLVMLIIVGEKDIILKITRIAKLGSRVCLRWKSSKLDKRPPSPKKLMLLKALYFEFHL